MPWWGQFSFTLLLLFSCVRQSNGWNVQSNETATDTLSHRSPETAVRLNGLIRLDVTVTNQAGNPIGLLQRSDFTLLDNGHPQKILAFQSSNDASAATDSPAGVVVLLDMLDMPPEMAAFERQQTIKFLRRNEGFLVRPITVYSLGNLGLTRISGPSQNGNLLADALAPDSSFKIPIDLRGISQDAIDKAYGQNAQLKALRAIGLIATEEFRNPGRKLLLWVGSGLNDWGSGAYLDPTFYYRELQAGPPPGATDPVFEQHLFENIAWFSALLREARMSIDTFSLGEQAWSLKQANWGLQEDAWKLFLEGVHAPAQASVMDVYK